MGRLDAGKAVGIFLEALTLLKHKEMIHVDIVGDGPLKKKLQQYALKNDIDSLITWHGQLERNNAIQLFNVAHLHVITSISEGNPTVILEAMSCGVPTLSFDHCGMHDTLRDGAGILIPIASTYKACVQSVADAIDKLFEQPNLLLQLAEKTVERAHNYTWEKRRVFWNELYEKVTYLKNAK